MKFKNWDSEGICVDSERSVKEERKVLTHKKASIFKKRIHGLPQILNNNYIYIEKEFFKL